jgi:uncharacterized protein (DUF1501 family)
MAAHDCIGCREYNELSRRQFLAGSGGIAAAVLAAPAWLPNVVFAQDFSSTRDIIISVYLRGGADGLTLCVPHAEDAYYAARPTLAVPRPDTNDPNRATDLDGFFGVPQPLRPLIPAYQDGNLLIVHAVGSQDASRSHFDAQRFMEVGVPRDATVRTGWLGRHLASVPPLYQDPPLRAVGVGYGLQQTLQGSPLALPIANMANFGLKGFPPSEPQRMEWLEQAYQTADLQLRAVAGNTQRTIQVLDAIDFVNYQPSGGAVYPNNDFGYAFKTTAALIKSDVGVEAVHIDLGGWDTHATHGVFQGQMFTLMNWLALTFSAFHTDMFTANRTNILVVALSEFGRVIEENGSQGTDHGHGDCMLLLGGGVAGGRVLTQWPGLEPEQRYQGRDLQITTDYRDILAEVVSRRLDNQNLDFVFPNYTPTFRGVTI